MIIYALKDYLEEEWLRRRMNWMRQRMIIYGLKDYLTFAHNSPKIISFESSQSWQDFVLRI